MAQRRNTGKNNHTTDVVSPSSAETTRRNILKKTAAGLLIGGYASMLPQMSRAQTASKTSRILVVYFSRTGNTRAVAQHIHGLVGGDIIQIRAAHAYPADYRETTEVAKVELRTNARPKLANDVADTSPYNTVFIGYPNWWGTLPMALFTFMDRHDLSGKTIIPFCTHEGSRLGRGPDDIRAHYPKAKVLDGLALRGGVGGYARSADADLEISAWVRGLKLTTTR